MNRQNKQHNRFFIPLLLTFLLVFSCFILKVNSAELNAKFKDFQNYSSDIMSEQLNAIRVDTKENRINPNFKPSKNISGSKKTSIDKSHTHGVAYQETSTDESVSDVIPSNNDSSSDVSIDDLDNSLPDKSVNNEDTTNAKEGNDTSNVTDDEDTFQQVKGGVTNIRATVGKSQIIQFAQPIKRLSVTDPSLADLILLSPTQMIMNGKAAGVTSIIIWDESDEPAFFELYVQNDTSALMDALKMVAPDEPINLKITDDGNVILGGTLSSTIVRDQIAKIAQAYGYTLVDVSESPVPQVVLELKIAEISRSVSKNFSVRWKAASWADTSIAPTFTTSTADTHGGVGLQWTGNSQTGFTLAIFEPTSRISTILEMGQNKGLLNVMAEPKIVSTHGREATFDAGNQVPVPTGVDQNGNLAYEYKDVGVRVAFTPWISEKSQRIELKITPEVSEIDPSVNVTQPNGSTIFGFRSRKASTTVELENGETLMIAGLIRRNETSSSAVIPFYSSIPIIGKLFNTAAFTKGESELVIMVTPKIIKPGVYGDMVGTAE